MKLWGDYLGELFSEISDCGGSFYLGGIYLGGILLGGIFYGGNFILGGVIVGVVLVGGICGRNLQWGEMS